MDTGSNIFHGAHDFVVNIQGDRDAVTQGMKALSERVIEGAEYNSSLRDPPPQCHPGTRVQLMEKIITWFRDERRKKALLWLNGPAGVGKSAVIQTVAESLTESSSLGATLFFSRLNDRKDPQRVVMTIAFQLATRIPAYRTYITERIAFDPTLLKKGMKEQFRTFIAEPFGSKGIGKREGPWAILLDGLDECDGVDEQCKIVQFVGEFILNFPDTPFVWVTASRPEPHLVAVFAHEAIASIHWQESIPINSPQACRDVEYYLNVSFDAMRQRFAYLPSNWPSEIQFLKLTRGALGLFIFARIVVHFVGDPNHADPVSRLDLVSLVIDRSAVKIADDHDRPFVLLDALYTQILTSIPPSVWRITKRILGLMLCTQPSKGLPLFPLYSDSLLGVTIVLGLELSVTYGSLYKLHSVLEIPESENAHKYGISFLHASFGDYLLDRAKSQDFYIDLGESLDDATRSLFKLYLDKPWDTEWERYAVLLPINKEPLRFYENLRSDAETGLCEAITGNIRSERGNGPFKSQQDRSDCLNALSQIGPLDILGTDGNASVVVFLTTLWTGFREELQNSGLFSEVLLQNLKIDHLDYERNKSIRIFHAGGSYLIRITYSNSSFTTQDFKDELQKLQLLYPEECAVICGRSPEKRIAIVREASATPTNPPDYFYYCFPYPY